MGIDVLSDLLRAVHLRGAVFYYIEGTEPWAAEAPPAGELIPAIMPGADALIEFHCIARGSCWGGIAGEAPMRLEEGDVVLFPRGDPHVISSAPGLRGRREDLAFLFAPAPRQLPFCLRIDAEGISAARLDGGGRTSATVVCGFLALDAAPFNPLLESLPRVLHLSGQSLGGGTWIGRLLTAAVEESNRRSPGGEAILERMSEMMFVEVVRRYLEGLAPTETGWLAAMRDPGVYRALALLHGRPGEAWTVERLAKESGLSRSVLHERFTRLLGQAPMQYLARWRMQRAAGRLRGSDAKIIEIALDLGYASEAAFTRAFKRTVGTAPGAWRRHAPFSGE